MQWTASAERYPALPCLGAHALSLAPLPASFVVGHCVVHISFNVCSLSLSFSPRPTPRERRRRIACAAVSRCSCDASEPAAGPREGFLLHLTGAVGPDVFDHSSRHGRSSCHWAPARCAADHRLCAAKGAPAETADGERERGKKWKRKEEVRSKEKRNSVRVFLCVCVCVSL